MIKFVLICHLKVIATKLKKYNIILTKYQNVMNVFLQFAKALINWLSFLIHTA